MLKVAVPLMCVSTLLCSCTAGPAATHAGPAVAPAPLAAPAGALLEQYALTNRSRSGAPGSFRFTPDHAALLYLRSGPRDRVRDLYELDLASGTERLLASAGGLLGGAAEEMTAEEKARRERARDAGRGLSSFALSPDGMTVLVPLSGRVFLLDRGTGDVRELGSDAGSPIDVRFSPDGTRVTSVRDGDLYVQDATSGDERRLTTREHDRITNGEAEFIAQEEMGRSHGYWWSPDSTRLAYQHTDTSMVETFRIMDPADPGKAPAEWPYPRPGRANADVTLGVISAAGGETVWIEWDHDRYPYLATVKWPEGAPLTLVVEDREQTEVAVLAADPQSGSTTVLHTVRDDAWVDLDQSVPRWLADGSGFLWSTEERGAWQLELRHADGSLWRVLTTPADGYESLLGVDEEAGDVFFRSRVNKIETRVVRAPLDLSRGRPAELTPGPGLFSGSVSEDGTRWVLWGEDASGVRTVRVGGGGVERRVPSAREPLAGEVRVETGVERSPHLWAWSIVRPSSYDASRSYPVIVRVYGGPTSLMVSPTRTAYAMDQWFADHGFIVVRADGTGTPGQGRDGLRAIKGDFIGVVLDEQVRMLSALGAAHPEMDMSRVGVFGWSFGGYFSAMAVSRRPDVFRAGVAGAPVTDWLDYDTHYTERYMGLPSEADYEASSVLSTADELTRPLMLIHGTADDNVYFTHSAKLADRLLRAGRPFEFLPLPNQTHGVTDPAVVIPMYERVVGFFEKTLTP